MIRICKNCGRSHDTEQFMAFYHNELYCCEGCEVSFEARRVTAENERRQTEAAEAAAEYAREQVEMLKKDLEERKAREEREALLAQCLQVDGVYYSPDKTTLVACSKANRRVNILDGTEEIGEFAFNGCASLKSVTIPASVTEIGESAFMGCKSLRSVKIPASVKKIGRYAFQACDSLANVEIAKGVTEICEYAFSMLPALKIIEIPSSVTEIGDYAFWKCDSLLFLSLLGNPKMGENVFYECPSLNFIVPAPPPAT